MEIGRQRGTWAACPLFEGVSPQAEFCGILRTPARVAFASKTEATSEQRMRDAATPSPPLDATLQPPGTSLHLPGEAPGRRCLDGFLGRGLQSVDQARSASSLTLCVIHLVRLPAVRGPPDDELRTSDAFALCP